MNILLENILAALEIAEPATTGNNRATIEKIIAADLMSDILASDGSRQLILTSLASDQSIRTAHAIGAVAVLFVNGKKPPPSAIALAHECSLGLFTTSFSMFDACAKLAALVDTSSAQ